MEQFGLPSHGGTCWTATDSVVGDRICMRFAAEEFAQIDMRFVHAPDCDSGAVR